MEAESQLLQNKRTTEHDMLDVVDDAYVVPLQLEDDVVDCRIARRTRSARTATKGGSMRYMGMSMSCFMLYMMTWQQRIERTL